MAQRRISGRTTVATVPQARLHTAVAGSYTRRLFADSLLLSAKLREEAGELADAGLLESALAGWARARASTSHTA